MGESEFHHHEEAASAPSGNDEATHVRFTRETTDAEITESNYRALQHLGIGCGVAFEDKETPKRYSDDPDRFCRCLAKVLDFGRDTNGPWVTLSIIKHEIQLASSESVLEGYEEIFNQAYSDPGDIAEAIEAVQALEEEHPETGIYIELPVDPGPQHFYLRDMPHCVFIPVE